MDGEGGSGEEERTAVMRRLERRKTTKRGRNYNPYLINPGTTSGVCKSWLRAASAAKFNARVDHGEGRPGYSRILQYLKLQSNSQGSSARGSRKQEFSYSMMALRGVREECGHDSVVSLRTIKVPNAGSLDDNLVEENGKGRQGSGGLTRQGRFVG